MDVAWGQSNPSSAHDYHFSSAYPDGKVVYIYAIESPEASQIHVFQSTDMIHWSSQVAVQQADCGLFNTSVCRGPDN